MSDTFKTILEPSHEVLFKEKNSKFFGYAFPIIAEDNVAVQLKLLRKAHPNAGHFCYAYQLGTENITFRANDDGEPSNSAGMPIYGQIQSYGLTNVLVVVVRYFGGVKLGVGGLVSAYKTTAQLALQEADIIEDTIKIYFNVQCSYPNMGKVMRLIKEKNLTIVSQQMDSLCSIQIAVRKREASSIYEIFTSIVGIEIQQE